ncbi:MAG: DUF1648 domain-containing protein [Acidobacteriota bacterium]
MSALTMLVFSLLEVLAIGLILLMVPRVGRSGLLFGVYVGEEVSSGAEAERVRRSYDAGIVASMLVAIGLGIALILAADLPPNGLVAASVLVGFLWSYLDAHRKAGRMAPEIRPPEAVAPLMVQPATRYVLPAVSLCLGLGAGLFAISYAWSHYRLLPPTVPVHFGPTGEPDGWAERSVASVMLMPFMTLVMSVILGGAAFLTASAKRALRRDDGTSLVAQERFRCAMVRLLSGVCLLVTAMLALGSVSSVQAALGERSGLHPLFPVLAIASGACALGGVIYVALRYGQGGARLERRAAGAPLTDGLADNRRWRLGMFYVNRDDPSILVEKRFGVGYTVNLGNWKGVLLLIGIIVVPLGLVLLAAFAL